MSDLENINSSFNDRINSIELKEELQNLKTEFFGKNGKITSQFKKLGSLPVEKKKEFGEKFIDLARKVYKFNDERAKIKLTINKALGSNIKEVKSYE